MSAPGDSPGVSGQTGEVEAAATGPVPRWDVMISPAVDHGPELAAYVPPTGDSRDPYSVTGRRRARPGLVRLAFSVIGVTALVGTCLLVVGPATTWWYVLVGIIAVAMLLTGGLVAARIRAWKAPTVTVTAEGFSVTDVRGHRFVTAWSDLVSVRFGVRDGDSAQYMYWGNQRGRSRHANLGDTIDLQELRMAMQERCPVPGLIREPGDHAY